jgi:hypothetical protein
VNLDSINRWLGVLANLGVLIGIFVVVIEVNQNTTAIETDIAWSRAQWVLDYNSPRATDIDLAALETKYRLLSEEDLYALDMNDPTIQTELYRISIMKNLERIYQETRFLTRTTDDERRAQRNQILRDCFPITWTTMESIGYNDLDPEFADFLRETVEEMKSSPCVPVSERR